jgi:beta-phosphoglucomutase-like phosphatase (HAD superfamily)
MRKYILWDHDGVLVDTERWYFAATRKALAEIGVELDHQTYLTNMAQGISSWVGVQTLGYTSEDIRAKKQIRNGYYQHFLRAERMRCHRHIRVAAGPHT